MPAVEKILQKYPWLIFGILAIFVLVLRLPSLEHPFDTDSAGSAYHGRLILRGEPLYSTHHPGHHLPGVYYLYALAFFLWGDNVWAVKFLLLLWIIVTVYLLYQLGVLLANRTIGFLGAIFYAILTAHLWMWGTSAQIELFANLPRVAAFLLMVYLIRLHPLESHFLAHWKFIFVGLISAATFLFKAVYLSPLALAGFMLLLELWPNRTKPNLWLAAFLRMLLLGLGFAAGVSIVVLYFTNLGLLSRFLLVFSLGQSYTDTSAGGFQDILFYPLFGLGYNNIALLICSLTGFVLILRSKPQHTTALLSLAAWYTLSFIEAGALVRVFRFYYYLLIVPPLALLAAWFLYKIYSDIQLQSRLTKPWLAPLVLAILLIITFSISIFQNFNFYRHYIRYRLGQETLNDFLLKGSPFGPQLIQLQELADYIQARTNPTDKIYYWSEDVQLYYLADRHCAVDILWTIEIEASGPRQRIFAPTTKYVIVDTTRPTSDWLWLYSELAHNYQLEAVKYGQEIYRRIN